MNNEMIFKNEILSDEQLETISGGYLIPNKYAIEIYKSAGIKVKEKFFSQDEFFWNGQRVDYTTANMITFFKRNEKNQPNSIEEATGYANKNIAAFEADKDNPINFKTIGKKIWDNFL